MLLSPIDSGLPGFSTSDASYKVYRQRILFVCIFYLVVASLLAVLVRYGVMDEDFHLTAGKSFVDSGLNRTTLYNHIPPTGVASHLWYAFWMWLLPGISFVGLRLITCAVLALVVGLTYFKLRTLSTTLQRRFLAASWFTFISPYFFLSTSTVMTEGPALLFVFAGLLLLFVSQLQNLFPLFLASLFLGLATVARFYYIPLLPALFVVLILSEWQQYVAKASLTFTGRKLLPYLFILISLLPLVGLIVLWGGLTPPSFNKWSHLRSGVSFNVLRPVSTSAIIGVYIAPFVLLNVSWKSVLFKRTLLATLPIALLLALFQVNLFHTSSIGNVFSGPIEHSLAHMQVRSTLMLRLGLFLLYSLSFVSLACVIQRMTLVIRERDFTDKALIYSITFVGFFVASQAFIGGNHPFYERYLIHPWPFIGYILAAILPEFLTTRTYLFMAIYTMVSIAILARWGLD
ncbi:hypothetical protein [Spirosoma sp.]|uniref:hypothetical protein n=1 Tax=Spirosoma sp. TaxID=1899569 RepID=UPI003B3AD609